MSRRSLLRGAGLSLLALIPAPVLEACAGTRPKPRPTPSLRAANVAVEAIASPVRTFNPVLAADGPSEAAAAMLFDSLYTPDYDGSPRPLLASAAPEVAADGTHVTVRLRDARWSDGEPITSADVAFTYGLLSLPAMASLPSPLRPQVAPHLTQVSAPDPQTAVFQLTQPYGPFLTTQLDIGLLPQHVYGGLSAEAIATSSLNLAPKVVSGPFGGVVSGAGGSVSLSPNAGYHGGRPKVASYVLTVVPDAADRWRMLREGSIDIAYDLDPQTVAGAQGGAHHLRISTFPSLSYVTYMYNLDPAKSQIFQDARVRQALYRALDRPTMARAIYLGLATVAGAVEHPASWVYLADDPAYDYDPGQAEQLLGEAGFHLGADGIRANGDVKLQFQMLTSQEDPALEKVLVAMQQGWKDIGIDAIPIDVSTAEVLDPELQTERTFEVALTTGRLALDPDEQGLWSQTASAPGGLNAMDYRNPDLDGILSVALATMDPVQRRRLYQDMQRTLATDVPAPFLLFIDEAVVTSTRVHGFTPNAFADRFAGRRRFISLVQCSPPR
ncbi:MAG TPA: peptide ABC transporter substrate-binding protein [Candidatus Dormibacteraeota bacterium]|jgi:peptide/nickel transport system substrate-binding protein|nr:peptide ABC transporter substrate-binding protein [Candidatus Dormibacteraeota bacterium]